MSEEYRVNIDIYNGPLDLLLYLIRRDEVDICDIPIAHITEQYCRHVEILQQVDPNLAGDFLVMAATLMEIKTRMLLPAPEVDEQTEADESFDPRADLVRQLLEYKAFKDAADDLGEAAERRQLRFARHPVLPETDDEDQLELEDVGIWDLVEAFGGLLEQIGHEPGRHEVIYDDTPIELHAEDIRDRLVREGPLTLSKVFEGRTTRGELVGLFIAVLELMRQRFVVARQGRVFGDILLQLRPGEEPDAELDPEQRESDVQNTRDESTDRDQPAGEYVIDPAGDLDGREFVDEHRRETPGTGD